MEYQLAGQEVVIVAVAVWFVGTFINNRIPLLKRYSIPVAVTGGVLFSIIVTIIRSSFDLTISLNLELRDLLLPGRQVTRYRPARNRQDCASSPNSGEEFRSLP